MKRRQFLQTLLMLGTSTICNTEPTGAQTIVHRRLRCPILMYHYISPVPADADRYRRDLTVTPEVFEQHCAFMVNNGYNPISMTQLHSALFQGAALPDQPVVLTFDDGYQDAFTYAFPILQQYQMIGTFFIVSQFMEQPGYLSWGQAELLLRGGMEVENHSRSHQSLVERDMAFLLNEIDGAAQAIEATFLHRPRFFCYPAGRYDRLTIAAVRATGHRLAVTTQDGALHDSTDPFRLPRIRVRGTTGVDGLRWLLAR